jgi:hypothetical protein
LECNLARLREAQNLTDAGCGSLGAVSNAPAQGRGFDPAKGESLSQTRRCGLLLVVVGALAFGPPAAPSALVHGTDRTSILDEIRRYRAETWGWQRLMGRPLTLRLRRSSAVESQGRWSWLRDAWKTRAERTRSRAKHPPRHEAWLCIHRYEGAWRDPGAPYYGGLQMDLAFQRAYGWRLLPRKGTANHWTPLEQMWTAERAYRAGRGFYPWPTTARRCGLL